MTEFREYKYPDRIVKDHTGQKGNHGNLLVMNGRNERKVTEMYKFRINDICSNSHYKFSY